MAQRLGIADIDILSNAIIVGDGVSPGMRTNPYETPRLSFMMNVLFLILCRKIQSDDPQVPQDQSLD